MKTGPLSPECVAMRNSIEDVQAELIALELKLDEIITRVQQAKSRARMVSDLLDPAIEDLMKIQQDTLNAQQFMKQVWQYGHIQRWEIQQQKDSLLSLGEGAEGGRIEKGRISAGYATNMGVWGAVLACFRVDSGCFCVA